MNDFDRYLGKATLGNIPIIDMIHKQEEQLLKQKLQEAQKRHDDLKKQIEVLKGMSLMGLAKSTANPLVKGLDVAIGKGKEILGLVTGNASAIRKDTDSPIKNLKDSGDMIGLSHGDAAVLEAKKRGKTDLDKLARLRMLTEENARKQLTAGVEELIKALRLARETYGMTAEAAMLYRLEQQGRASRCSACLPPMQLKKDSERPFSFHAAEPAEDAFPWAMRIPPLCGAFPARR